MDDSDDSDDSDDGVEAVDASMDEALMDGALVQSDDDELGANTAALLHVPPLPSLLPSLSPTSLPSSLPSLPPTRPSTPPLMDADVEPAPSPTFPAWFPASRPTSSDAEADAASQAACGPARDGAPKRKRSGAGRSKGGNKARKKKGGFVDVPRGDHRGLEGRTALVDGNPRSCGQDALVHGAKALGVPVTKKQVHADTLPAEGDTEVGVLIDYARDALGIEMRDTRVPATLGGSLFQSKGGAEHALLQLTDGVYFVELAVSQEGKPDDRHAVLYNASYVVRPENCKEFHDWGYTPERVRGVCGVLLDNDKDTPVKYIEPSDRQAVVEDGKTVYPARRVFDSLFPFASDVRVVGVWLMRVVESDV